MVLFYIVEVVYEFFFFFGVNYFFKFCIELCCYFFGFYGLVDEIYDVLYVVKFFCDGLEFWFYVFFGKDNFFFREYIGVDFF